MERWDSSWSRTSYVTKSRLISRSSATYRYIKSQVKNTCVRNFRCVKVQHDTLWYYPGKESAYLRRYIYEESNSVPAKKGLISRSFATYRYINIQVKNTYVLNSRCIKVQHHTLCYYPGKELAHLRRYIYRVELCACKKAFFGYWYMTSKNEKYARTQHDIQQYNTLWYLPAKESRPYVF